MIIKEYKLLLSSGSINHVMLVVFKIISDIDSSYNIYQRRITLPHHFIALKIISLVSFNLLDTLIFLCLLLLPNIDLIYV